MKIWQVLVICGGLMLVGVNQSLWLDEAISANVVKTYSFSDIINKFSVNDFHPPLYYLALKTWTNIFGYSEFSLRLPSIIFVLVTVFVINRIAGINAAMLVGFNPLLIYYSQEARMYSLVTMLVTINLFFLIKKKYLWVSIIGGLCLLTFYGSVFYLATISLYLLLNKKYKELIVINIGPLFALLLLWPLLNSQYINSIEMRQTVTNWSMVLGKANIKNILLVPMKFTSGRISFEPKWLYYLISGSFAILTFSQLVKKNIYSFIFWMTLLIGIVFSIFTPMLQYFRFLYLVPIMGLIINKNKLVWGGFILFSLIYILNSGFYREDWQSMAKTLPNKVYMVASFGDPIKYYKPTINIVDIRSSIVDKEITIIPYGEEIHGVNHKNILEKMGYKLNKINNYRGVTTENWHLGT